jgi:hypothetical protein
MIKSDVDATTTGRKKTKHSGLRTTRQKIGNFMSVPAGVFEPYIDIPTYLV